MLNLINKGLELFGFDQNSQRKETFDLVFKNFTIIDLETFSNEGMNPDQPNLKSKR
jgi:hypothetical protein